MLCFVINLDRETKRLAWMTAAFRWMGLAFERFAAIDKNELSEDVISQIVVYDHHNWSAGEIACFMSHVAVWQRIADGDADYAAVFEDDVHFSRDAARLLHDEAWIPAAIDLIKLETTLNPVLVGRWGRRIMGHRLLPLHSFHNGAAAYIISKRLAAQLVATAIKIDRPVDDFLFDMTRHQTPCWQLSPGLCIQEMFLPGQQITLPSSLEPERQANPRPASTKARLSSFHKAVREARRLLWRLRRLPRRTTIPMGVLKQ
jgi:glycosyl transferase family 25